MTSQEFIIWLKGFTDGVHEFNVTPKQWDLMKEKLNGVTDDALDITYNPPYYPTGPYGTEAPNSDLEKRYPWGGQVVWAGTPPDQLTTGTSDPLRTAGYIAPVNQPLPFLTTTSGSSGTAVFPISGATITYTVSTGSGWSYNATYTTDNKTLLND